MSNFFYKTRGNSSPQGKPRVYFCCHPEDYGEYFELLSDDVITKQNCAIWHLEDLGQERDRELQNDLLSMQLFLMPVTKKLLTTENPAIDFDFRFAVDNHIPVLPVMVEKGLEKLFNERCGEIQFLDRFDIDATSLGYETKLERFLSVVLIGDELANLVRAAFDAYVFLSYRKKDRSYAQELMRLIHKNEFCRDIAIWYDEFLSPGEDFNHLIKDALMRSDLFVLAVTPNLVNEDNYVMNTEYPMARDEEKPILPVELVPTDRLLLSNKYRGIPKCANAHDEAEFSAALLETLKRLSIRENDGSAEHKFFIGLAYLGGIDVEVDTERALQLILEAAQAGLPEAMERLIIMYADGMGVPKNSEEACRWSHIFAEHHLVKCFGEKGDCADSAALGAFFENYTNKYWRETIRYFMILADREITSTAREEMLDLLITLEIRDYSVLFGAWQDMTVHREAFLKVLLEDLLLKTLREEFKPYAQLFCWPCIYDLYREVLHAAEALLSTHSLTKEQKYVLVTLLRDLCVINGYYDVRDLIEYEAIPSILCVVEQGDTSSYRHALNVLFYFPHRRESLYAFVGKYPVYPQIFCLAYLLGVEPRFISENGFCDELHLWDQVDSKEAIGLLAVRYRTGKNEMRSLYRGADLVTGLVCYEENFFEWDFCGLPYSFKNLSFISVPVGTAVLVKNCFSMVEFSNTRLTICLPRLVRSFDESQGLRRSSLQSVRILSTGLEALGEKAFLGNIELERIYLPASLKRIGELAFAHCANLSYVGISDGLEEIAHGAFYDCEALEWIKLPQTLKHLGFCEPSIPAYVLGAFESCGKLREVELPDGILRIGAQSFKGCRMLEIVTIPDSVVFLSMCVFENCISLKKVTLPNGIENLPICLFLRCSALETIVIPDSVRNIGDNAFDRCVSLREVALPRFLERVGQRSFAECTSLKQLSLPDTVTHIRNCAFERCESLESVGFPAALQELGAGAFRECGKLQEFAVSSELRKISRNAFLGCVSLSALRIPKTVIRVEEGAFAGCVGLKAVQIEGEQTLVESDAFKDCQCEITGMMQKAPVLITEAGQREIEYERYRRYTWLEEVTLHDDVTRVGRYAFDGCVGLKTVKLNEGLRELDDGAFRGCVSLGEIQFPEALETIGENAFNGCIGISQIHLPAGLKQLNNGSFGGCQNIETVVLPDGLLHIGSIQTKNPFINGVLMGCRNLRSVKVSDNTIDLGVATFCNTALETFAIPQQVTSIKNSLFYGCSSLRSVSFNQNITEIGIRAFKDCISLEAVCLPKSITRIEGMAFQNCRLLKEIRIPEQVVSVGMSAFEDCVGIENLVLPESLKTIGEKAFAGCSELKDLTFGNGISRIDSFAFGGCSMLKRVVLPDSLKVLGHSCFVGCSALESVNIPKGVKKIEAETFSGCESLSAVSLSETLEEIGQFAFWGCVSLKELTIPSAVKFVDACAFDGCSPEKVCVSYAMASRIIEILGEPSKTEELQDRLVLHY